MNRPLPPGDRGCRGPDPGRKSGSRGIVPGAVRLVGRTVATDYQEAIEATHIAPVCLCLAKGGTVPQPAAEGATWRSCAATAAFVGGLSSCQMGADERRW